MTVLFWQPSAGLRVACVIRGAISVATLYIVLRLFIVHVLLVPLTAAACVLLILSPFIRTGVRLDPARQQVAVTVAWWTHHIPLAEIESVDQILRFGAQIRGTRVTYTFSPFRKRRWLERHLHVRTGFEGMELAITDATARARAQAGLDERAGRASQASFPAAALLCGLGLAAIAAPPLLVRPQVHSHLVHVLATLLQVWWIIGGAVGILFGLCLLVSRIRNGRPGRPPDLASAQHRV